MQTADAANKQEARIPYSAHLSVWPSAFRPFPRIAARSLTWCKATVQKIVTEILPPSAGVAFARESRDLLIECCVEFITLISSEANEISEKEAKKTIACDHITKALEQLGFSDYVPAVMEAAAEHKETQKVRRHGKGARSGDAACNPSSIFVAESTNMNSRAERRNRTNLQTAACLWRNSPVSKKNSLLRPDSATADRLPQLI